MSQIDVPIERTYPKTPDGSLSTKLAVRPGHIVEDELDVVDVSTYSNGRGFGNTIHLFPNGRGSYSWHVQKTHDDGPTIAVDANELSTGAIVVEFSIPGIGVARLFVDEPIARELEKRVGEVLDEIDRRDFEAAPSMYDAELEFRAADDRIGREFAVAGGEEE